MQFRVGDAAVGPKATLWLCAYSGVSLPTHNSIIKELTSWPNLSYHDKGGDANIDRARSKVASWFLADEDGGDVLLMVDSDQAWEVGDLKHIAKRALEHEAVVGGVYPKRIFGQGPAMRVLKGKVKGKFVVGKDDLMIPAEFVGTGFIAIPRTILTKIGDGLPEVAGGYKPFFMPEVWKRHDGVLEYPTDDAAFGHRVTNAGFKVFANTYPKLTHIGDYEFRMLDAMNELPEDRHVTLTF